MMRFKGKTALVTGAATGIGRAAVLRLAAEGAAVYAVDRNAEGLREVETAVIEAGAGQIITRAGDVSDEATVRSIVSDAAETLGGIDILANIAGIHKTTPLDGLSVSDFQQLISVNVMGTFLFCRETMPHLRKSRGVVVNIASTSATHAHPYMTAYAATKGAVLAFSLSLAAEVAQDGVRVVAISPGGVVTPLMTGVTFPEDVDSSFYGRIQPQLGFGDPAAIAGSIAYAASDDGAFLTGVELRVDGGSHV
ncbi:SDR family NAD(P)-dependent oxidoreductase [Hoyosella altamirensis]|uniref:NAD(P)-dependent dehydrogenase (Short-subunit alcohol dehydrogenase family) n=1 Tax=Hoyosella altamirensis TaxID=616997 RepID=A0A839RTJ6_9ACTN|nr:SDR family oxidoreductase [Hoyosella altamirensis]MBB3039223.1 NAD(P)-dependent dehydrogenase (short-subunit alcohol dehydrogenase family) [Hoyosella altamirensis]